MLLTTCLDSDPTGFFLPSGNLLVGVLLIHTNKSCWRLYPFTNWDAHRSRINLLKRPATQLLEKSLKAPTWRTCPEGREPNLMLRMMMVVVMMTLVTTMLRICKYRILRPNPNVGHTFWYPHCTLISWLVLEPIFGRSFYHGQTTVSLMHSVKMSRRNPPIVCPLNDLMATR